MAGATGLEPATSAVTGQRSNQLSYAPVKGTTKVIEFQSGRQRTIEKKLRDFLNRDLPRIIHKSIQSLRLAWHVLLACLLTFC